MSELNKELKGLGGWLVLVAIGLIISPIRLMFLILNNFLPIFTEGYWEILTTPGSEAYHHLWAPILIFEIFGNLLLIGFIIFLLILFFTKSFRFPKLMIIFISFNLLFIGSDFFIADLIPDVAAENDSDALVELLKTVVAAVIWIPYFLKSIRVKNTFIKNDEVTTPAVLQNSAGLN